MKVKIITFASIKDICGFNERNFEVSEGMIVSELLNELSQEFPDLTRMSDSILFARNEEYCAKDAVLYEGDTLAIFPPVSGG